MLALLEFLPCSGVTPLIFHLAVHITAITVNGGLSEDTRLNWGDWSSGVGSVPDLPWGGDEGKVPQGQ